MLICEELFLLLTKDSGTPEVWGGNEDYGLRGALLADLALHQRLTVEGGTDPRFRLLDTTPTGHPAMDHALAALPAKDGKRVSSLMSWTRLDPRPGIVSSLASAGTISVAKGGFLGMQTIYPTLNPGPEQALRQRLYAVLHGQAVPTQADRTLLAVLQGLGHASTVLPRQYTGMSGRDLKRRITELAKGDPAGDAVSRAVEAVDAALITAVIVPTVVTS
ncbi:GPP34 family phosphoprotein [Actinomyces sp. 2119]|uniref:GOLPH3/VPS74 family protein n=1 Tax=Actinomyces sp. 2119 TaxID=2321393 RepID=UPI000E6D0C66|nr:GPP34 family phosphoprotein [Actinomyces sp. 2119]RJF40518.1 GPP34 family phosphoprotein [Actinomyces sp. 2119]RJF41821.1 GPP34 family phosphoprotein [Actinomyces sp. 2119]